jgi:hypothetical protein
MRLLISGFDDGERAGMDYYGEARCMVGLVLGRGEERRRGGEAARRRLASRKARITSQVSRMTWEASIMYHVWVGRRARTEDRQTRQGAVMPGVWCSVVHGLDGWCTTTICWEMAGQRENLWPTIITDRGARPR